MKICKLCKIEKSFDNFFTRLGSRDGLRHQCKMCMNLLSKERYVKNKDRYSLSMKIWYQNNRIASDTYNKEWRRKNPDKVNATHQRYKLRREKQLELATPPWADIDEINRIYDNCPEGYAVDHCIPLLHKNVCGLHVPANFQYLTIRENLDKAGKFPYVPKKKAA